MNEVMEDAFWATAWRERQHFEAQAVAYAPEATAGVEKNMTVSIRLVTGMDVVVGTIGIRSILITEYNRSITS